MDIKKVGLALVLIIILIGTLVISEMLEIHVGDTSESIIDKSEGEISYKEIRTKEVIGFETVYKQEEYIVEECSYTTLENITLIGCYNETYYKQVVDDKAEEVPIYSYSDIIALEYDGKRTDFIDKGCFICEGINFEEDSEKVYSGRLILCLLDIDYRPNIKSCWIESGVSYKIKDLDTNEVLYSHFDKGVMIR